MEGMEQPANPREKVMENGSFQAILERLRTIDQKTIFEQLHALFESVTKMSADQAIAAYQAISLTGEVFENEKGGLIIQRIKEAIVVQMTYLASTDRIDDPNDRKLQTRFETAIGTKLKVSRNSVGKRE